MDRDSGKVVIVTGASSGIGRETALAFARKGYRVTLAARRTDRLEELVQLCRQAGGEAMALATDVAHRDQVEHMVAATVEKFGRLDVLVNNAGQGLFSELMDITEDELRHLFDVNFFGLWYGMMAALPVMLQQGSGHIFNVSSVIGKRGTPLQAAYCATKFAVSGLTEVARVELRPRNIHCTLVCPALTETEFFDHGTMVARKTRTSFRHFQKPMPPAKVAHAIAAAAGRDKTELVFSLGARMLVRINAMFPRVADAMMEVYRRDLMKRLAKSRQE